MIVEEKHNRIDTSCDLTQENRPREEARPLNPAELRLENATLRENNKELNAQLQRLRAERVAHNGDQLMRVVNSMPILVWSAEPNGMVDFLSENWLAYTGMNAKAALGAGWIAVIHPDDIAPSLKRWKDLMSTGTAQSAEVEVRFRRSDGQYRWFLVRACALRDQSGAIRSWYGTNIDIHDRKLVEDEIRRSEASLGAAQRIGNVGSFSWSRQQEAFQCSEEFYRILDLELGTPVTLQRILDRVHPDGRFRVMSLRDKPITTTDEHENRLIMADGSEKVVLVKISRTDSADGTFEYHGAIADITARRRGEDALAQARADLAAVARAASMGEMAAAIAHEVSQPLLGIMANAELSIRKLSRKPTPISEATQAIGRIIRDANRASEIVRRLRDLYSDREPTHEAFDLNEALIEVLELSRFDLEQEGITVDRKLSSQMGQTAGDRVQIQQVVLNLLRNAIESIASNPGSRRSISIHTYKGEDRISLTLEDSGAGFQPEQSRKLFDSFFTTKPNGMGMGLSVSRSIIEAHQGILWARNNDRGGATFGFDLPAVARPKTSRPSS